MVARIGGLHLDLAARTVELDGHAIDLTRTEFDLLALLARQPGTVFGREAILPALWGAEWIGNSHATDVHIAHIRQKLGVAGRRYVQTVHGVGYRIQDGS
jgi:DNA-binding response OmpR family regulator